MPEQRRAGAGAAPLTGAWSSSAGLLLQVPASLVVYLLLTPFAGAFQVVAKSSLADKLNYSANSQGFKCDISKSPITEGKLSLRRLGNKILIRVKVI